MNLKAGLEGILFIVGDEGTTINEMVKVLGVSEDEVKNLLMELKKDYEDENRGLRVSYLGNAFKLTTKEEHKGFYEKFHTYMYVIDVQRKVHECICTYHPA